MLTENHKRSLSSTLIVVEQMLVDMKNLMVVPSQTYCLELNKDISFAIVEQNLKVIEDALAQIYLLQDKYNTDKSFLSLQRVVNAKKSKIWETLHNTKSTRIKGFGEFPQKDVKEYDNDIDKLIAIAEKIKIK